MTDNVEKKPKMSRDKPIKPPPEVLEPHLARKPPAVKYAPNIVPLIDVLFMLLLYFLLSTHFRQTEGDIPGTLPSLGQGGGAAGETLTQPITIMIRPAGENNGGCIFEMTGVNTAISAPEDLYQKLVGRKAAFGDAVPIIIKPGGRVQWQHVVEAFNQSVRAQFKNIGFGTSG